MVTLSKIYTRSGDHGVTGLVGGKRVKKTSRRVSAYGDIDELNSQLGVCLALVKETRTRALSEKLVTIQNELFDLGSELATPAGASWEGMLLATPQHVRRLETWIDELNDTLPNLRSFILPGGSLLAAHLHVARAVCRRAERSILALHDKERVSQYVLEYINRMSDLLFVMARHAVRAKKLLEYLWVPGGNRPRPAPRKEPKRSKPKKQPKKNIKK